MPRITFELSSNSWINLAEVFARTKLNNYFENYSTLLKPGSLLQLKEREESPEGGNAILMTDLLCHFQCRSVVPNPGSPSSSTWH